MLNIQKKKEITFSEFNILNILWEEKISKIKKKNLNLFKLSQLSTYKIIDKIAKNVKNIEKSVSPLEKAFIETIDT